MENQPNQPTPAATRIKNQKFENESVVLDFHEFTACEFRNCQMIFLGYGFFGFNGGKLENCK
jgi:hypothetical protein